MSESMESDQQSTARERRPNTWAWPATVIVVVLLLVAGGVTTVALLRGGKPSQSTATVATPAASATHPVSSLANTLDEHDACVQLVPLLQVGADQVVAIAQHPDGSTVDSTKLDSTVAGLNALVPRLPANMRSDAGEQLTTLQHLQGLLNGVGDPTLDLESFKSTGIALSTRCSKYAS